MPKGNAPENYVSLKNKTKTARTYYTEIEIAYNCVSCHFFFLWFDILSIAIADVLCFSPIQRWECVSVNVFQFLRYEWQKDLMHIFNTRLEFQFSVNGIHVCASWCFFFFISSLVSYEQEASANQNIVLCGTCMNSYQNLHQVFFSFIFDRLLLVFLCTMYNPIHLSYTYIHIRILFTLHTSYLLFVIKLVENFSHFNFDFIFFLLDVLHRIQ